MRPLENTFSWSLSRRRTFQDCPLRYWFHYYGSWGGWEPEGPETARELYLLKNLTNLHLIAGDVVHRAIERVLTGIHRGVKPEAERTVAWCKSEMQSSYKESQEELWRNAPKQFTRLFEHHYGPRPDRAFLQKIATKIGTAIRTFFDSRSYSIIRETDPGQWLPMETLDSFEFEGTTVYAVPDFACRHDDEILIFDWKTGRPDKRNKDQLVLYSMFAAIKWDADPDKIRAAPVYLLNGGDFKPATPTAEDRERVTEQMRDSIHEMQGLLVDVPTNTAHRENFRATPGYVCRSCNFRGVCPDAR